MALMLSQSSCDAVTLVSTVSLKKRKQNASSGAHNSTPPCDRGSAQKPGTANQLVKSQIEQWREDQKGVTARLKKLKGFLTQVQWCTTSEEVASALSGLGEFITESETPIPTAQLKRIKNMLENDDELWSEAVKVALEVVEAQCQAVTQALQGKLRKAKLLHGASLKTKARAVAKVASTEKELDM